MRKFIPILITAAVLTSCSNITGREDYKTFHQRNADREMVLAVDAALKKNEMVKREEIHISIDRGIVQLSGFIASDANRRAAVTQAFNVKGVKDVIDSLIVRRSPEYAEERIMAEKINPQ